ncbi:MAG: SDR family oxidoreductase [Pseudomonadota bacterium]
MRNISGPILRNKMGANAMELEGKAIIVTGAGQGIGQATVKKLAERGARVAAFDLNGDAARESITSAGGGDHTAEAVDVSDSVAVRNAVRKARDAFGRLDGAVNNAGIGQAPNDGSDAFYASMAARNDELSRGEAPTTFVDHLIHMEDDGWRGVMKVNLDGAFFVCRETVRVMAEDGHGGAIVNISSTSAQSGEGSPHHVTSKAALIGLTRQLSRELAARNIRVNAVAPGPTDTPIMANVPPEWIASMEAAVPLGRMASPDEIGSAVAYLLSDGATFVTGSVLVANGGSYMF